MTTNQIQVITSIESFGTSPLAITHQINTFIQNGIISGYINFQVLPVVVSAQPISTGPPPTYGFMAQINYYDPGIM